MSTTERHSYLTVFAVALTLGVGIVIGTLITKGARAAKETAFTGGGAPLPAPAPAELSSSFSQIADTVSPAVVNIQTESTLHVARRESKRPNSDDDDSDQLFQRFFSFGPNDGSSGDYSQSSLGSGVILDKSGFVLTNYHVVTRDRGDRPVDKMLVKLRDDDDASRGYPAHIVGLDKWTDLAVIKFDAGKPLPTVAMGDSDAIRVGDWVLAIGSPFGLNSTVTAGIISAKGRTIEGGREGEFKRFLQTDAAINPGNSGGPLVNLAGQVVGVNTAIATNRGSYEGVCFAVPSNVARKVYNDIVTSGGVHRGAIGVSFTNGKNQVLLRTFGADHGVVVDSVESGSPAERAGLRRGDVITSVDGKPVAGGDELLAIVSNTDPGKELQVEFLRDKKPQSSPVVVGDWNKLTGGGGFEPAEGMETPAAQAQGALGLSVKNLSAEQAREIASQLHLAGPSGVLVADVKGGSFAEDLSVSPRDIILSINHQPIASVDDFNRVQRQLKSGDDVLLLIARRSGQTYTTLYLADKLE